MRTTVSHRSQAITRGRFQQVVYFRKRSAAPILQASARGQLSRSTARKRLKSIILIQRIWRGCRFRLSYGRLKKALLLDEEIACEVMRNVIAVMQRGRVPGTSLESAMKAKQLFQQG